MILKRTDCRCSRFTVGEAGAGLAAAEALAVGWLEKRRHGDVGHLAKEC